MKPGTESQTAVLVCMARAIAHARTDVARFADPTAMPLLPAEAQQRVQRVLDGAAPRSRREGFAQGHVRRLSHMMVARTVAIDDAIRGAGAGGVLPQLVTLGAGLDGRAWRMPALRDATVFEVDHPDSQRTKQQRAAALEQVAGDVRFVPVDFGRDDLDAALTAAGHATDRPTTWVWEGVVMYLEKAAIEATLRIIARRSAPGSRLIICYHSPALLVHLIGFVVRRLGEPLRSAHRPAEMRALLEAHGFRVQLDQDVPTIASGLSAEVARWTRPMRHLHVVTAERR
ncbi:MAG: class I SAM-dependent methyltransferase [Myxococcales bacterium]|nr:class I SAM-dependent methyltransferase [Myxococcales bacterium]